MLNVLDLCAGIGGFSLGLERAGMKTVAFCELDPFCQQVLKKNFSGVPIYDDVRTLTAGKLAADGVVSIDVITAGYPCQPFSLAGKRQGQDDPRHVWPEIFRIVTEVRPHWCIFENVVGHVTMGLEDVLTDLENAGYSVQSFIVPAAGVGASHMRDRVWIVAADTNSARLQKLDAPGEPGSPGQHTGTLVAGREAGSTLSGLGGSSHGVSDWMDVHRIPPLAVGQKHRNKRLKALGNAVVPQIPEAIGKAILAVHFV